MERGHKPTVARGMDADEFESLRPYLFAIAYRMLGSASEAEDVVQDAYLRAQDAPRPEIRSPKAYLATIVTRLCLDQLKSARATRETYLGPWLPEPVPTADLLPAPVQAAERREEISLAFLVLLERLTPEERAAYVLREAFEYPYDEIAAVLGKSAAATRQLAHRARQHVAADRPRFTAAADEQRRLTESFLAARRGDLHALTDALAADVVLWADGGAKARAARRPIHGCAAIANWLVGVIPSLPADTRTTYEAINGEIAVLLWLGDELNSATILETRDGRVQAVRSILNPDKLAYLRRRVASPT